MIKNVGNKPYSQAIPIRDAREGMKFNRLTLLKKLPREKYEHEKWLCECECGEIKEFFLKFVLRGTTKSCGCYAIDAIVKSNTTHGFAKKSNRPKEYGIWKGMVRRCHGESPEIGYGDRKITVCERWKNSFSIFYEDMGPRPSDKHSIDRIDNDGHYEPSNCRWATSKQQSNNKRNTIIVNLNGENIPLTEACERLNISYDTVRARLRNRWEVDKALSTPILRKKPISESDNKEPPNIHQDLPQ
jgi:hypothetical protein